MKTKSPRAQQKRRKKPVVPVLENLKKQIEELSGLDDIAKITNKTEYVICRAIFYNVAMMRTSFVIVFIAEYVNKDHATLLNAEKKFSEYMRCFPEYRKIYDYLSKNDESINPKKIEEANQTIFDLERKLKEIQQKNYKSTHKPLFELLDQVPDHHVETLIMRLEPIIKMLPKQ